MTDSEDRKRGDRFEFVNENRKIDKNIRKHRGQKPDIGTTMYVKHRRHRLIDKNRGIHMQIRSTRTISFDFRIEKNISPTFDLQTEKKRTHVHHNNVSSKSMQLPCENLSVQV